MILQRPEPAISFIIPAHDEAENLPTLVREIVDAMATVDQGYEIVIIDDQSGDPTPAVLEALAAEVPQLVCRRMVRQSGQSAALVAGFDVARGDIFVTMDADCQNDPADVPRLLEQILTNQTGEPQADMAIGWRRDRRDPISKKIISKVANAVRNWVTSETVRDTGCGLKAFRRECVAHMPRFDGMHRFFPTLAKMRGYRVVEVPVNHRPRVKGATHYNLFNRFLRPMQDLLAVRWLQARTRRLNYALEQERVLVRR